MRINRADLALALATVFWAITFPLIKLSILEMDPLSFVFIRFSLALIILIPFMGSKLLSIGRKEILRTGSLGLGLAVLLWASYQSQTIGLKTVEAGRTAFITGSSVILVPLLCPLFGQGYPSLVDLAAAVGTSVGLYLLTGPGGGGLQVGDLWVGVSALSYSVYVLVLQSSTTRKTEDHLLLFFQIAGLALLSGLALIVLKQPITGLNPSTLAYISICSVFATIGSIWLQTRFQRETSPTRAVLVLTLEPVFASLLSFLILGECFTAQAWIGASIIIFSILFGELTKNHRLQRVAAAGEQ